VCVCVCVCQSVCLSVCLSTLSCFGLFYIAQSHQKGVCVCARARVNLVSSSASGASHQNVSCTVFLSLRLSCFKKVRCSGVHACTRTWSHVLSLSHVSVFGVSRICWHYSKSKDSTTWTKLQPRRAILVVLTLHSGVALSVLLVHCFCYEWASGYANYCLRVEAQSLSSLTDQLASYKLLLLVKRESAHARERDRESARTCLY
jgi:hypothetical protein